MSRTYRKHEGGAGRQRRISARAVRRNPPDLRLLSKALLMHAADEAAAVRDAEVSSPTSDSARGAGKPKDDHRGDAR